MADTIEVQEIELTPEFKKLADYLQRTLSDQQHRWLNVRNRVYDNLEWQKDRSKTYPGELQLKEAEGAMRMAALIQPIQEVSRMVNWVLKGYSASSTEAEVIPQLRALVLEKLTTIGAKPSTDPFQNLVAGIQLDFYREVSKLLQKMRVR